MCGLLPRGIVGTFIISDISGYYLMLCGGVISVELLVVLCSTFAGSEALYDRTDWCCLPGIFGTSWGCI